MEHPPFGLENVLHVVFGNNSCNTPCFELDIRKRSRELEKRLTLTRGIRLDRHAESER